MPDFRGAGLGGGVVGRNGGTGTWLVGRGSFKGRAIAICRVFLVGFLAAGLAGCASSPEPVPPEGRIVAWIVSCNPHSKKYDETLRNDAWALISEYSPEGVFMTRELQRLTKKYCGVTSQSFAEFVKEGKKDSNYYRSIGTTVHELAHDFTAWMVIENAELLGAKRAKEIGIEDGLIPYKDKNPYGNMAVYLAGKGIIHVPRTKTFPSKKIAPRVPEDLRDEVFDLYIQREANSSQRKGVYGLLNEFHAYYHDQQIAERMLRSELKLFLPSDFLNFLIFKYYILEYLDYGREHEPEIFEGILANKKFVDAFLEIHDRFEKLYLAHLEFRSRNIITREGGWYNFRGDLYHSVQVPKTYAALTRVLDQKKFDDIMALLRARRAAGAK